MKQHAQPRLPVRVMPGYGCRSNEERIEAWRRRRAFKARQPTVRFDISIFKPE